MEDNAALIQEYQLTIESMQHEVTSLKEQLASAPKSLEELQIELETLNAEIEEKLSEISDKNSALADLQAEHEWICFKYPCSGQILSLLKKTQKSSQALSLAQEKRLQEESQMLEVEKLKKVNPKLHLLVKKMIQADRQNLELKKSIQVSEEDRKNMRQEYAKITTALGLEDKVKRKIKELEVQVSTKKSNVENLRTKLETIRKMTNDTIDNIENSVVKEIIRKCNETRTIRTFLSEQIQSLQKEFDDLVEEIDNAEKNPKKIAPAVANQNLRTEVKSLETFITERSNLIKERERERHQLTFHLEQSSKELVELRAKVEMLMKKQEEPKRQVEVKEKTQEKKPAAKGLSQKAIEAKRNSVLEILGKGNTEGMGKEVMKVLKGVGQPGQGLASKVLELNRSQFPQAKGIISK